MPIQKTCGHCGGKFSVSPRRHETVKFCSIECKNAAKRVAITCAACGALFERKAHLSESKYCSNDCYNSVRRGAPKKDKGNPRYYCSCEQCGVSFRVTLTRKDTARFCSRKCQSQSPAFRLECSESQRGEKSWRWTGGLHQLKTGYVRERGRTSGKTFRFEHRLIIERAIFKAEPNHPFLIEVDGKKKLNPKVEVHHIDRNRSHNEFSNLLAVTKDAHAQLHHRNKRPEPWECWPYSNTTEDAF